MDEPTETTTIQVILTVPVRRALERRAARERRSLSNIAAVILEDALIESGDLPQRVETSV